MQVVKKKISLNKLQNMAKPNFGNIVKAVVDIKKKIIVIDAELQADQEEFLLKNGSNQKDLWNINLKPYTNKGSFIEFDSVINLRPHQNNLERGICSYKIRNEIKKIVNKLVEK
jgi:hypothetical protein